MIRFSVLIPAYNNPRELRLLLTSIRERCSGISRHEVIVIDDGSRDNSIELTCSDFAFVRYLRSETNRGVAYARNLGAEIAASDILVFIDSDLIVQTDFISILSERFQDNNVVALSGTSSAVPANPSLFRDYWGLYKAYHMPKGEYTTVFTGQQGAIRKGIFWKAGGWDSNIRGVSKEEYEFTSRLEKLGVRIHYEPGFELKPHFHGFWRLARENYKRTKKWCIIFLSRRKFDDYTSTFSGGMSYALGGLILVLGAAALLAPEIADIFYIALFFYLALTVKFWIFIAKKRGVLFTFLALFFHLVSSLFILSGAIHGLAYFFTGEEARRRAINN